MVRVQLSERQCRGSKLSRARNAERVGQATMIAASLRQFWGGAAPACRGATSPRSSVHGRPSSTGLIAGPRTESGIGCFFRWGRAATTNVTASTARATVRISMPPGAKGAAAHGIGRSRGGLSTKVHLVVDALGLPLIFEITEGQRH